MCSVCPPPPQRQHAAATHLQRQARAAAPQQHHVCWRLALGAPLLVDRVALQHPPHAL